MKFETIGTHTGGRLGKAFGAVSVSIYQAWTGRIGEWGGGEEVMIMVWTMCCPNGLRRKRIQI